jgi:hypothetical protein
MWRGLSEFFGAPLVPAFVNTTTSEVIESDAPALELEVSAGTLELISSRTAADTIVYRDALRSEAAVGVALIGALGRRSLPLGDRGL